MAVLKTQANPNADTFKENAAFHKGLVAELNKELTRIKLGGHEKAREKHLARGKLLPRERINNLLDKGAPFLEFSALAAHGMYDADIPAAGIITW